MSFMKDQAPRLIREKWANPDELAEEIYAIWMSDTPVNIDGSVVINNSGGGPSLTINQGDTGDTTIIINNYPGPQPQPPNYPPGDTIVNNEYITNIYGDGTIDPPAGGGGGGFVGTVVSGSGNTYEVSLLGSEEGDTVTAFAVGLSEDATLDPGTDLTLVQVDGDYYAEVPRWL